MEWNEHWVSQLDGRKMALPQGRLDGRKTGSGELAQAIAAFNAMHPVHELLASAGVELLELGREWHTVNGCPLPGCTSTHDAFRVHIDRKAGDTRGPQWACRKCGRGGDALRLAMLLAGADPVERGATARFLRERGHLADTCGQSVPDSRARTGTPNNGLEMGSKHPARTRDSAQERLGSPGAGSGHVKARQRSFERKETRDSDTNQRDHRPSLQGQVPRVPPSVRGEGQATPSASTERPPRPRAWEGTAVPPATGERQAPFTGEGQVVPSATGEGVVCTLYSATARAGRGRHASTQMRGGYGGRLRPDALENPGGQGAARPADPLRWSRPDAIAAFGRHPTPEEIEALDERAGIIEFDAGLTRQNSELQCLALHFSNRVS